MQKYFKLKKFITFLISLTFMALMPQVHANEAAFDKDYKLPNLSVRADGILLNADILFKEFQRQSEGKKKVDQSSTINEILNSYHLPDDLDDFEGRYFRYFRVSKDPKSGDHWLELSKKLFKENNNLDAAAAAIRSYHLFPAGNLKAESLKLTSQIYGEMGEGYHAINIFNIVLQKYQKNSANMRQLKFIIEKYSLRINNIVVNNEQKSPNACILFSHELKNIRNPEDYVSIKGVSDLDVTQKGNRICMNGLEYGTQYKVFIKAGLKAKQGTALYNNSQREFIVKDRERRINFAKNEYILSKSKENLVPITTVNLKSIDLRLMLIHDRNLVNNILQHQKINRKLGNYHHNEIRDKEGTLIWEGSIDIDSIKNRETTSLIEIDKLIKNKKPGIYIISAKMPKVKGEKSYYRQNISTQWLIISDLGLTSLQGKDGIHIIARSLETAQPLSGIKLNLMAYNNQILGTTVTDENGFAHFKSSQTRGQGGDRPALITAFKKGDYNFVSLKSVALDLSERGVSGRSAPQDQDLFLYTDRGVYRPGGTVRLSGILRDGQNKALGLLPLRFKTFNASGTVVFDKNIMGNDLGGYQTNISLSQSAKSGSYYASISLAGKHLSSISFRVEDFVPQRIKARISNNLDYAELNVKFKLDLQANFLYGPPAAGLKTVTRLSIRKNPFPFPKFKKYHFGLAEESFYGETLPKITGKTNEAGLDEIPVVFNQLPDISHSIGAYIHTDVFDVSGRPVSAKTFIPLRMRDVEIGLKSQFSGALSTNDEMHYSVIALDKLGKTLKGEKITYDLVREDYYYGWYRSGRYWNSRRNITDTPIFSGKVVTDKKGIAHIKHHLKDGRYRLNIRHENGTSMASHHFYVGWYSSGNRPNTPDALELSIKQKSLEHGDQLTAFVKAPFKGHAVVMVMNEKLHKSFNIDLPKEGAKISFKVDKSWGTGAYLMVTAFRPGAGKISKLPTRTLGLKWFSIGHKENFVKVNIDTPETITPRQEITLPIHLKGNNIKAQKIHLTIAAVDEGILGLTNFKSPSPAAHYLAQRRLGLSLYDLYGNLIKSVKGLRGKIRSGGDIGEMSLSATRSRSEENTEGVRTKTVKTVALFEKDILIDDQGKGTVTLKLPDFNGTLRLMSVAYGKQVIGSGSSDLIVRDPVVAELLLPRFMAPSDVAEAVLSVHNLTGKKKRFTIDLNLEGKINTDLKFPLTITLEKNERFEKTVRLTAQELGTEKIKILVTANGIAPINRSWDIAVRPAGGFITERKVTFLSKLDSFTLDYSNNNDYIKGSVSAYLTLTNQPNFNVRELLNSLTQYPYGCAEQTTSKALPLLYYSDMAKKWDKEYDPFTLRRSLDGAVRRLLDMQRYDGSFALWSSSGDSKHWLTAYVFDFLSRAIEKKIDVPKEAYNSAARWLKKYALQRNSSESHIRAYAFYVLSRAGLIKPGQVRYFADHYADQIRTPLGMGHIAAALAHSSERKLADEYFTKAFKISRSYRVYYRDYGSNLRDHAALVALLTETFPADTRLQRLAEILDRKFLKKKYFSTQEKAWLLIAAHNISSQNSAPLNVLLNSKKVTSKGNAVYLKVKKNQMSRPLTIANKGGAMRIIHSIRAVSAQPLPPVSNSFDISRVILTLKGNKANLSNLKQNEIYVVTLSGKYHERALSEAMIVDLLPAGFEIENAAVGGYDGMKDLKFIPSQSSLQHKIIRDDRFVAALDLRYKAKFSVSYLVRAVTPGTYVSPAPFIEDMYNPQLHARGRTAKITIHK